MFSIRTVLVCLGLLLAAAPQLDAADRIFLPSGVTSPISALSAADLAPSGSIDLPCGSPCAVLAAPGADKYYVVRASATDTIGVVDTETLTVTKTSSLGTNAADSVITPDGKYLLVAAGLLRVFSTETDEEVTAPIPVGGAPTQVLVNNASTRAYVLAASGHSIQLIDLVNFTRSFAAGASIVGTVHSMVLTEDDSRLIASSQDGLKQFSATNLQVLNTTPWGSFNIIRGQVKLVPGSAYAFIENGGSPPNVNSLLVGLEERRVRHLGEIGNTNLDQITPVDGTTAYAVESGGGLVKIDFTDPDDIVLTTISAGLTANTLTLSPNRRFLFGSSPGDSRVIRLEIETDMITHSVVAPAPPVSHAPLYDPVSGPPARLVVSGGNDQSIGPDKDLPVELSVKALSSDGTPMAGQAVLFTVNGGAPIEIIPNDFVLTNQRGIASVKVHIPPLAVLDAAAALNEAAEKVSLAADAPPVSEQNGDPIQAVTITATSGGAVPAGFTVSIVREFGLVKLSGDHQVIQRGTPFPLPIVMLATDLEGNPLPAGTVIEVRAPGGIVACGGTAEVDHRGIVTAECISTLAGSMQNSVAGGFIIADATVAEPSLGQLLGQENFSYNVGINPRLNVEKLDGDLQTGQSGTALPRPLRFVVNNTVGIPIIAQGGIGVTIRQISGPPVILERQFMVVGPGVAQTVGVTLGPAAGSAVIEVQASGPDLPSARFTVTSTGGQPQRLEKLGDGQSGRIGSELPNPLQVRVFNESNQLMPAPAVTWTVLEGDAQLVPSTTANAAIARVLIGNTPGTIRVQARAGSLTTTFVVEATPPQPVSISTLTGQNQTLVAGVPSEPLMVVVNEANNQRASGVVVTFSGPPNVLFRGLTGSANGNPLERITDSNGQAGVRAELVASAALESGSPSQANVPITITASVGGSLSTTFVLNVVGPTPTFEVSGVVNTASGQPGVVPGSLATIYGSGLSLDVSGTVAVGGETSYQGTIVRVGRFQAPLISITGPPNEQINFQVPFELSAGSQTTVEVENNGSSKTIGGVLSFTSQPGIFTVALDETTTVGAVIHGDTGALVTPDDPAELGEVLSVFLTGGGPVNPNVASGSPAPPGLPPVMVLPVVVGINHGGSEILFSGYAPGFIGLYQINFRISPAEPMCGVVPLNIRVGTVISSLTSTVIACPE
jgi:uncharacterized protein (TIGR03437 family)